MSPAAGYSFRMSKKLFRALVMRKLVPGKLLFTRRKVIQSELANLLPSKAHVPSIEICQVRIRFLVDDNVRQSRRERGVRVERRPVIRVLSHLVCDLAVGQRFSVEAKPVGMPSPAKEGDLRHEIVFSKDNPGPVRPRSNSKDTGIAFLVLLPRESRKHVLVTRPEDVLRSDRRQVISFDHVVSEHGRLVRVRVGFGQFFETPGNWKPRSRSTLASSRTRTA